MIWHFGIHYAVYVSSTVIAPTPPPPPPPPPPVVVIQAPTTTTTRPVVKAPTTTTTTTTRPLETTTTTIPAPTTTTTQPKQWTIIQILSGSESKSSPRFYLSGGSLRLHWECAASCNYALVENGQRAGWSSKLGPGGTMDLSPVTGIRFLASLADAPFTFTLEELR